MYLKYKINLWKVKITFESLFRTSDYTILGPQLSINKKPRILNSGNEWLIKKAIRFGMAFY